jgi:hypothetical protein
VAEVAIPPAGHRVHVGDLDGHLGAGEARLDLQVQRGTGRVLDLLEVEQAVGLRVDAVEEQARHRAGRHRRRTLEHELRHLGGREAERVHRVEGDELATRWHGHVLHLAGVGVEHHDALGLVGIVGEGERVGRAGVPHALHHLRVEVVVAEQHEVGLDAAGIDLDLVDVGVARLDLGDARVGEQQVGAVDAALLVSQVERFERGVDGEHLRDAVHAQAGQVERRVRQACGEHHVGERVGQRRVGRAGAREARRVVVATDHDQLHPVLADLQQGALGDAERAVGGAGVVEHVAEPDEQVGLLGEGEVDRRGEGLLEVELAAVHARRRVGDREVGAPQVGVAQRRDLHALPPISRPAQRCWAPRPGAPRVAGRPCGRCRPRTRREPAPRTVPRGWRSGTRRA